MKKHLKENIFIVIIVTVFAVLFSEFLVHFQMMVFWQEQTHEMGYWLGFWTPLIDGVAVGILAIYLRSFYEKKLKLKAEQLHDFVEASTDFVWEVDKNGVYTYASEGVVNILGYTPDEVIGKTPFDFMYKEEIEKISKKFEQVVQKRFRYKRSTKLEYSQEREKSFIIDKWASPV